MTRAEMKAFIIKQIEYYKRAVEFDQRQIEFCNNEIKRQRAESKRLVEYVYSSGVVTAHEAEYYTPNYKNAEQQKAERERAKHYRWKKQHAERLSRYENELKQYEPQQQPEEAQAETIGAEIEKELDGGRIANNQICVYIDKNNNIKWLGKAEFAPVYLDFVKLDHIETEGNERHFFEAKPAEDAPQLEEPREICGTIAETGEPCKMCANGYWTGERGRHITSYERTDKQEYNKDGKPVFRQYSMDRHRRFYLETEDEKHDY